MKKLFTEITNLPLLRLFILAVLIRFLLMPLSGHWDLVATHAIANTFFTAGWRGFYTTPTAAYPPLTFLTFAAWQWLIHPFLGTDFASWLNSTLLLLFRAPHVFRYFFLLKLLYVPFDLGTAYLLRRFGRNEKEKNFITAVWLFNPIVLYVIYLWGSFDIIPVFFTVLAVDLIYRKKSYWGFFFLAVGGAYKLWPLLLVVPVAVAAYPSMRQRLIASAVGLGTFFLILLPYLRVPNFRQYVLVSDRVSLIGNAELYMGFSQALYLYLLFYVTGIFAAARYAKKPRHILDIAFHSLFWFFVFSAYTPQFFLWILPFIVLTLALYPKTRYMFWWILVGYVLVILTFDAPLAQGLFSPVEATLLHSASLKEIVERVTPAAAYKLWSAMRTVNSAILLWFLWEWWQERKKDA